MEWNEDKAQKRIREIIHEVPAINVQQFDEYSPLYEERTLLAKSLKEPITPPLFDLSENEAVVVNTVQMYVSIVNYDEFRLEEGSETLNSHERALRFLHLYYSIVDRLTEESIVQRVDFHGSRVHLVALERGPNGVSSKTILKSLNFIRKFKRVAKTINEELMKDGFRAEFRIGVDVGVCVAICNGTGKEKDPLFLGNPANFAAKLAEGNEPGVNLSPQVYKTLGISSAEIEDSSILIDENILIEKMIEKGDQESIILGSSISETEITSFVEEFKKDVEIKKLPEFTEPNFKFSYKEPPLCKMKFADLVPSDSKRMPIVSLYADLSGFTKFICDCIENKRIEEAVRALFVIRKEFQNVVEVDFGGKKVRFVGDCIHAIIAEGSSSKIDFVKSISSASKCAGGLFSSFHICKRELQNLEQLGLAVGIEIGETPVSRIGIHGDRSVRVASSIATTVSEMMQKECGDKGIKYGPNALKHMPKALRDLLDRDKINVDVSFLLIATCLSQIPSTSSIINSSTSPTDINRRGFAEFIDDLKITSIFR